MAHSIWLVIVEELNADGEATGRYVHRCFRTKEQAERFMDMLILEARVRIADAEPPEDEDLPPFVGDGPDSLPF